ncbi:MAG TPA: CHAP domain-containing protein [Allosphingosinicella sp.]|nr:CHAP domain-containing protein [Allosphingosinicella sp.]
MSFSPSITRFALRILLALGLATAAATPAAAALQCAPYARAQSGIEIHGNAGTWWDQAAGRYRRGSEPQVGAVLAFQPSRAMPIGHVAVVAEIVDDRHVYLNHANWSGPGRIERRALAEDVSENGDWSEVRVWYAPQHSLGLRANRTAGFIYNEAPGDAAPAALPAMAIAAATFGASAGMEQYGRLR